MNDEHGKVEQLFHAALEFNSTAERNDFLDQECASDPHLRARIDRILNSYEAASGFLEQNPTISRHEFDAVVDSDATLPPQETAFCIDQPLPHCFGDYELLEKIAHGGMGVVFRARQPSLNRIVAVKMILSGQIAGEDEVKRFYVEAEAAGNLDHPGIVPVFDVGCHEGQHYYSMAFVEGQSLSDSIKKGPIPPKDAALLARKIAIAMEVAHEQGIVHRDLKPGNVLLDERSEPRITDFGLAKRVEGDSQLTATGMVLGTPSYMPPEQASGKGIEASADVYSLGAILYAMLTGHAPFEGNSQLETILQVLQDEPISVRKIDKSIPKDLEAICMKCLEKNASSRYGSAAEFAADLNRFLNGEPIQAQNDWRRRFRKWTVREPVLVAHLAATLVMLAIVLLAYWIWRDNPPSRMVHFQTTVGNVAILLGSALLVLVFQKTQNLMDSKFVVPFAWAASNPVFLTIGLCWNIEPEYPERLIWLLPLYFLLMVTCCFFRRAELVAICTTVSLIGCAFLIVRYFGIFLTDCPSYIVVFVSNMAGIGCLLGFLTLRMKRLGERSVT